MKKIIIDKNLAQEVIMVSVIFRTTKPCGGGVSTVLECYDKYFDGLRHIPTWKDTNKLGKAWYFFYHYIWLWILLIFDRRIKIVHVHTADGPSFIRKSAMMRVAKRMGKKVILHMHAASFHEYYDRSNNKDWIFKNVNICDKLIVLSEWWKNYFLNFGIDERKIVILNNIVGEPNYERQLNVDGVVRLLFLGWLGERKGIWDLLDVIIKHKSELTGKLVLRFGGNGFEDEIKKKISDNHIEDICQFEGWVNGQKKTDLLNWANVFILPSYNEGLPISILEAMSHGLPIISTPVGGIPEVVKKRENGLLIEPGNKEQIWLALKHYIDNPECIQKEGDYSFILVKSYTPDYVLEHLKSIYESLL